MRRFSRQRPAIHHRLGGVQVGVCLRTACHAPVLLAFLRAAGSLYDAGSIYLIIGKNDTMCNRCCPLLPRFTRAYAGKV